MSVSMSDRDWPEYYKATKTRPPRPLLIEALTYATNKNKAIDLGGGALTDTKYLLEQNFDVTVVDKNPLVQIEAKHIGDSRLHVTTSSFEEFDFPYEHYDIACAMFALPFVAPAQFHSVFERMKGSLKKNGIFCGHLLGDRDGWNTNSTMTFHTRVQAERVFRDMEIISFKEEENDIPAATGEPKHWHIFHIIARKVSYL
jgi:tellurite methyltransferase